ncbi:hypothetical protein [Escherichia coli]|uniref:hypothetical protein n=1 Tax=Escherichia coli TaxID=562 RepID=UPI0021CE3E6D|nr:hypothetical protein [Escherichia coli]MCU6262208.1 hypothetical protein [Escherichia coli]
MRNNIYTVCIVILLTGCASSKDKPVEVVDANRAAGTVEVGFVKSDSLPLMDDGQYAQWHEAPQIASTVCKRWGYERAVQLTSHSRVNGVKNGYGFLMNGSITKLYQCLNAGEE